MTPPDSGEREVREFPTDADGVCRTKFVLVPQDLAQRILAAMEEQSHWCSDNGRPRSAEHLYGLASELRAVVERKP